MPFTDMTRSELVEYAPELPWPRDLEEFWSTTLAESRALVQPAVSEKVDTVLTLVDCFDVTFSGFGGHPIRAWLHVPANVDGRLPAVVLYSGYGGGRGLALDVSVYVLAGYACLKMDTRGQGSARTPGDTPDPVGAGPTHPGFMTKGILDRHDYYYHVCTPTQCSRSKHSGSAPRYDRTRSPWLEEAREAGSPWLLRPWFPTFGQHSSTCRSCAIFPVQPRLLTRTPIPRSCDISASTATTSRGPFRPSPISTPRVSQGSPRRRRCSPAV
jgi:hypothetical protein